MVRRFALPDPRGNRPTFAAIAIDNAAADARLAGGDRRVNSVGDEFTSPLEVLADCGIVTLMHRLCALIVLAAVSVNALWCVDGCIDPFADHGSYSTGTSNTDTSEATLRCVVCVVPFEQEQAVTMVPTLAFGLQTPAFRPGDAPMAPRARIEHPPRTL